MEKRLKLGISRMFGLSFFSCRNRVDASDMAHDPIFLSRGRDVHHVQYPADHLQPPPPPPYPVPTTKRSSFPSLCRSRKPMADSTRAEGDQGSRKGVVMCPPAPPASPLNSCCRNKIAEEVEERAEQGKRKKKKTRKKRSYKRGGAKDHGKNTYFETTTMIPSTSSADSHCFFSSEDERKILQGTTETFLSRKSFSSDSSSMSHRRRRRRSHRLPLRRRSPSSATTTTTRRRQNKPRKVEKQYYSDEAVHHDQLPKGGFAVVKQSSDPHADFRSSMVEMIMEKQIFGARELEQLLYCFLSLNSPSHHLAILDVFEEICQALFSNWS